MKVPRNSFCANAAVLLLAIALLAGASFASFSLPAESFAYASQRLSGQTYSTDVSVNADMILSSGGQNILTPGADPNDLPNNALVCPGTINANLTPSVLWAATAFSSTSPIYSSDPYPANSNTNDRNLPVQLNTSLESTLNAYPSWYLLFTDAIDKPYYIATQMPAAEGVTFVRTISPPDSQFGTGSAGLVCGGTVTINGVTKDISQPSRSDTYTAAQLGAKTYTSNLAINSCTGAVVSNEAANTRKYLFGNSQSGTPHTSGNVQGTISIVNPQTISPSILSITPSPLSISPGESKNITITVRNNNADAYIFISSQSASNGFTLTPLSGWSDPIAPSTTAVKIATITAPASASITSVLVSLGFSSVTPNCQGVVLTNTTSFNLSVVVSNNPPVNCSLSSPALAASNYTAAAGSSYAITATCTDATNNVVNCTNSSTSMSWTTTFSPANAAMSPTTTTANPDTSNLVVSPNAASELNKAVTATHSSGFNCNLPSLVNITSGTPISCTLNSSALAAANYTAAAGNTYPVQANCFNDVGILVSCSNSTTYMNWTTSFLPSNALMVPAQTLSSPHISSLVVSATPSAETGKNITAVHASGFSCTLPSLLNLTAGPSCTLFAPSTTNLGTVVGQITVLYGSFTTPTARINCGNGQPDISMSCSGNPSICVPVSGGCNYTAAGAFTITTTNPSVPVCTRIISVGTFVANTCLGYI